MIEQDSTTTSSDTAVHDRLMAMAEAADRGAAESPLDTLPSATQGKDDAGQGNVNRADDSQAQEKTDSPESSASSAEADAAKQPDRPRDESGKFTKKEQATDQDGEAKAEVKDEAKGEAKPETKPESGYTKAQKDDARQANAWKQIQAEKDAVRKREQELSRLQQDVNQLKRRLAGDVSAQARFDSKQYHKAAAEFEQKADAFMKDGETEQAQESLRLAKQCRVAAGQASQAEYGEAQQQFEATWRQNTEAVIKDHPELGDPKTEIAQAMMQFLDSEPIFAHIPDGFAKGYQIVQDRLDAAEVSGLRSENAKLKSEVTRLNAKLSPLSGKSGVGHSTGDTGFNSWSTERQRAHLERQAELADQV